jgi:uncharacterized membrane protein YpjA
MTRNNLLIVFEADIQTHARPTFLLLIVVSNLFSLATLYGYFINSLLTQDLSWALILFVYSTPTEILSFSRAHSNVSASDSSLAYVVFQANLHCLGRLSCLRFGGRCNILIRTLRR